MVLGLCLDKSDPSWSHSGSATPTLIASHRKALVASISITTGYRPIRPHCIPIRQKTLLPAWWTLQLLLPLEPQPRSAVDKLIFTSAEAGQTIPLLWRGWPLTAPILLCAQRSRLVFTMIGLRPPHSLGLLMSGSTTVGSIWGSSLVVPGLFRSA